MLRNTGEYEKCFRRGSKDFYFFTFTPTPLMSGNFFDTDDELLAMLVRTHREIGILEGITRYHQDRSIIRDLMIMNECCYSYLIDHAGDSFYAFIKANSLSKEDAGNVRNIISAYEFALSQHVSTHSLSGVCKIALYGQESDDRVRERDKSIFLGRAVSNLKVYNPTAPEKILPAIADIVAFLRNDEKTDILAKVALAHYQFEMIHPYECCNGIVGRTLISMILHKYGIRAAAFLGLSEFLYYNKNDYFEILRTTQYSGGYIALVKFFVRGIHESSKTAINRIDRIIRIIADDEAKIVACGASAKKLEMVYDYFKSRIFSKVGMVSVDLGISFNTTAKLVTELCEMNILQLENEQSRHRVFYYGRLFEALTCFDDEDIITDI